MNYIKELFNKRGVKVGAGVFVAVILICWFAFSYKQDDQVVLNATKHQSAEVSSDVNDADPANPGQYDYTEAVNHIGEQAAVSGTIVKVFTSKNGTTFFDFCKNFDSCPFSAVIFASAKDKFPDLSSYQGKVTITGTIKSYQGRAEIVIDDPSQISAD